MANIKHAVVGTDMLVGSSNAAYLKSVVFYKDGSPAAIDNGNIVVMQSAPKPTRLRHLPLIPSALCWPWLPALSCFTMRPAPIT